MVNLRGERFELAMIMFLLKRAPALERLVLVTVDGEEAAGHHTGPGLVNGDGFTRRAHHGVPTERRQQQREHCVLEVLP
jgi:hypothetical protein